MPILMFLRQYGLREYAITLGIAALAGLGIAVLINSAAGGSAGAPAVLKTKQELADASSRVLTTRVYKPAAKKVVPAPKPARHHRRHRVHRHVRSHPAPAPAPAPAPNPAPKLVAVRAPTTPQVVSRPAPRPAPAPVVHKPAPKPAPKPKPKPSGGGSVQFDDSG
jgi:hypothetical protein